MKDPIKLRTIFMGTSSFAAVVLESLAKAGYNVISVYTQTDKKSGRSQNIQPSAVELVSQKNSWPVLKPEKFDEKNIIALKEQKPDLIIVAAYGKILPKNVLNLPGFGAINVHASLLPKFRGPSPIQNAILDGVSNSGVTIMLMNEGIDSGDILREKKVALNQDETYPEVLKKMAKISSDLLLETVPLWIKRKIKPQKQNEKQATYCQLIERSDGKIIWENDAKTIYNQWRAFVLWPGIFTYWKNNSFNLRLKLHKIALSQDVAEFSGKMGQVFNLGDKIAVKANEGAIILEEVQLEGKNKLKVSDFVNGHPEFMGAILK